MRVVVDARMLRGWTGIERYLSELLRRLPSTAPDLHVLATVQPRDVERLRDLAPDVEPLPVDAAPFSTAEQHRLPRVLRRSGADLVHFVAPNAPVTPVGPRITTFHDLTLLDHPDTVRGAAARAKLAVLRRVMSYGVRTSRLILVPSRGTAAALERRFPASRGKIEVTHLAGPDVGHTPRWTPTAEPYLLHVGNAYPYKNLDRLVYAFAKVAGGRPRLRLILAGKPDAHHHRLAARAAALGVGDRLTLAGQVSDAELHTLYAGASLFVMPSLSEGFGLPALEAMAHGTPTLVARATSLPEVCGDAAAYFDPLDVDDLAAAIDRVLADDGLRRRLSRAGVRRSGAFSWARTTAETVAAYRAAVRSAEGTAQPARR
jgi:glycosyltransferase involved in cell wall biosynthesis